LVPGIVTYPVAAIAVGMFLNFAAARRYVFAQR
jgi:putative flippase GtrA